MLHLAEERWHRKCKGDVSSCENHWKMMSVLGDALLVPGGVGDRVSEG